MFSWRCLFIYGAIGRTGIEAATAATIVTKRNWIIYIETACAIFFSSLFLSFLLLFTLQHYKYIIMPICRHRRRHSSVSVASSNSIVDCSVCLLTIFIFTIYSVRNTETILFVFLLRRQGRLQLQWKHIIFGRPIGRWSLGEKFNGTEI